MKYISVILLAFVMIASATSKPLPLEYFAKKSEFKSFEISPDGKHVAYTFEDENQVKMATMNLETKKGVHSFSVGEDRQVSTFRWLNNERLYFVTENVTGWLDGAEKKPEAYFVNYDGKKRKAIQSFFFIISRLENSKDEVLIAKPSRFDGIKIHKLNIHTLKENYQGGEPKPVGGMKSNVIGINVDNNDQLRIAFEFDPKEENNFDDDEIYFHVRKADGKWKNLTIKNQRRERPDFNDLGFNKENNKFFFTSNYDSPDKGTSGLFVYDFNSEKIELLYRNPDTDILGGLYDPDGILYGVRYEAGYPDYFYLQDESAQEEVKFLKSLRQSFPNSAIITGRYTDDRSQTTLVVYCDKNPADFYIFDRANTKVNYLASAMPHINPKEMARVEPFTMNARDGLKMYGQMTIPNGKDLKNLPMVVYPHGGPYGPRDTWGWDNRAQMLANNGYLVLQINFRGSGGYGANFQEAGYGLWGTVMQDDITDATLWAIQQGFADKDRICIHGVSYGGYASLQAVVKEPDLYKCSIPDAGTYDLSYHMKSTDMFKGNNKRREWFFKRMIGENFETVSEERSPVYHLDELQADLFIVHGKEDVRVTIGNAKILEEKLKERGIKHETMYKKDGHGFQKVPYRIELYEKMLAFLDKHIGE